jgi:uncharacterized protein (DUF362 family)
MSSSNKDILAATVQFEIDDKVTSNVAAALEPAIKHLNNSRVFKKHFAERVVDELDLELYNAGTGGLDTHFIWDGTVDVHKTFVADDTVSFFCCVQVFVNMTNQVPITPNLSLAIATATPHVVTFRKSFFLTTDIAYDNKPDPYTITLH